VIGMLSGILAASGPDGFLLDVQGIGYEVRSHARDLQRLPATGSSLRVHTDLQFRNDALRLYGFLASSERDWFRLLCAVHHVGAKGALSILSALPARELAEAVAIGNAAAVQRAHGVGRRIAERVVAELKGKAPAGELAAVAEDGDAGGGTVRSDAVLALTGLGFGGDVALRTVAGILAANPDAVLEDVIRMALQSLGRQNE